MMPSVASFLTYFKGLTGNKKKFIAFGSYGWGGQSPQQVYDMLAGCKAEALLPAVKVAYKPSAEQLDKLARTSPKRSKRAWNKANAPPGARLPQPSRFPLL